MCWFVAAHPSLSHPALNLNPALTFFLFATRSHVNITYSTGVWCLFFLVKFIFILMLEKRKKKREVKKKEMYSIRPPHATASFCCVET